MKCAACGEQVETHKISDDNWQVGCECWITYSLTPSIALTLYVAEMQHRNGKQWARSIGLSGDPIASTQLVGEADC